MTWELQASDANLLYLGCTHAVHYIHVKLTYKCNRALTLRNLVAQAQTCLQKEGFSDAIIDRFFKPFLGGIFFDNDLKVTSRLFEFVMRMLASGENSLPANGIGAISEQMAAALPAGSIKTGGSLPPMQPDYKQ